MSTLPRRKAWIHTSISSAMTTPSLERIRAVKNAMSPLAPFFNTAHYYIPYMEICLERMIAYRPYRSVCAMDMGKMCGLLHDYPGVHGALAGGLASRAMVGLE